MIGLEKQFFGLFQSGCFTQVLLYINNYNLEPKFIKLSHAQLRMEIEMIITN